MYDYNHIAILFLILLRCFYYKIPHDIMNKTPKYVRNECCILQTLDHTWFVYFKIYVIVAFRKFSVTSNFKKQLMSWLWLPYEKEKMLSMWEKSCLIVNHFVYSWPHSFLAWWNIIFLSKQHFYFKHSYFPQGIMFILLSSVWLLQLFWILTENPDLWSPFY